MDSKSKEKRPKKEKEKEKEKRMLGLDQSEERWESEKSEWCNWALSTGKNMNFERLV